MKVSAEWSSTCKILTPRSCNSSQLGCRDDLYVRCAGNWIAHPSLRRRQIHPQDRAIVDFTSQGDEWSGWPCAAAHLARGQ
jgi:hypothetical protein